MRLLVQLLCDKYNRKDCLFLNIFFTLWPFFRLQRCLLQNCLQGGRVTLVVGLLKQEGCPTCLVNALLGITRLPGTAFLSHA